MNESQPSAGNFWEKVFGTLPDMSWRHTAASDTTVEVGENIHVTMKRHAYS